MEGAEQNSFQRVVPRKAVTVSLGILLKMQILRAHRPTESETGVRVQQCTFNKPSGGGVLMYVKSENHYLSPVWTGSSWRAGAMPVLFTMVSPSCLEQALNSLLNK